MSIPMRALALALLVLGPASSAWADVRLAVWPPASSVAPGDSFAVTLQVPIAGSAFNGFDAVVSYDPSALAFLPATPMSAQEGPYMRLACGNTFHLFSAAGDSLAITDVLLCAGDSLTGPGEIYTLAFRALPTPGVTPIRIRSATFYEAGLYVTPVVASDATVTIGPPLAVSVPAPGVASVRPLSNPARGSARLEVSGPAGPERLAVCDAAGRQVRVLASGPRAAGSRAVVWDGRDDAGRTVPAGLYFIVLRAGGRSAVARLVWLR